MRLAQEIWEAALGELQLQVNKPNYNTWLKDTSGISFQDDLFVVGVPNVFIAEWLTNRLYSLIRKTLANITGRDVDVQFVTQPLSQTDTPVAATCQTDGGTSSRLQVSVKSPRLNPRYTFNTFITGEPNRLAYAAALEVAEAPAHSYNPLLIYGDTGVGKTHLLHAVGHALKVKGLRIVYVNAEQFTNQFVTALKSNKIEDFHHRFRNADALLVDDIQFLSGKTQTQECFFHIFNDLYDSNCQIMLISDLPPRSISSLTKRLRSRLEWGLVADMQPPDIETRLTILDAKAKQLKISFSPEVLQFLATQFQHNVRELEGALNRVGTYAKLSGTELDIHLARQAVRGMVPHREGQQAATITPEQVINSVAGYYKVTPEALIGKRRDKKTALARHVAMYLLREQNHCSLSEIGKVLGYRDHTTVLHGCEKISAEVTTNPDISRSIHNIRQDMENQRSSA